VIKKSDIWKFLEDKKCLICETAYNVQNCLGDADVALYISGIYC